MLPLPNSFQVPNELVDEWFDKLTASELKVLIYICRRTLGFNKPFDDIALSQLEQGIYSKAQGRWLDRGTGLKRSTIKRSLRSLERHGLLLTVRRRDPQNPSKHLPNCYRAFPPEAKAQPLNAPGVGPSADPPVGPLVDPGVGPSADPTKPRVTKPRETQTDRRSDLPGSSYDEKTDWDRLLKAIQTIPKFQKSTRRGQKWEQEASESDVTPDILAQVIERNGEELAAACSNPVVLIAMARELYEAGHSGITAPIQWTALSVRAALTQAFSGDDEALGHLRLMAECDQPEVVTRARLALLRVADSQRPTHPNGKSRTSCHTSDPIKSLAKRGNGEPTELVETSNQLIEQQRIGGKLALTRLSKSQVRSSARHSTAPFRGTSMPKTPADCRVNPLAQITEDLKCKIDRRVA